MQFTQEQIEQLIQQKVCLAIMGPTASGKSSLSMALAKALPVEIISVDSALIYQGMDIGTAKPSAEEMAEVPHHLIDILSPAESYSAADFVEDVHELVEAILARGKLPMLVGGTMMYFNALQKGMATLPSANEEIRAKIYQAWLENPEEVHQKLCEVDPEAGQRIHQNDPQRLIRALEVYEMTGKPLSQLQKEQADNGLKAFKLAKVALLPDDRKRLHEQIALRFQQMVEAGFIKEAETLFQQPGLHADLPAIRSVGYRQAWSLLHGEYGYETFIDKSIVATRQLAKRQITWLRKEQDLLVLDPFATSEAQRLEETIRFWASKCNGA